MKVVLSPQELKTAIADYVVKNHPAFIGKNAYITFEEVPLTQEEWAAVNSGLRVERQDWVQVVVDECPSASAARTR